MSFLDNQTLEKILPDCVDLYAPGNLQNASYELCLGNQYFVTNDQEGVTKELKEGQQIIIKPGQCALLLTKEIVTIPENLIAFISMKATVKFAGLINISGFHVDPGFSGKLMFAAYNAGSSDIVLEGGQKLFPIWFCELNGDLKKTDLYNGKSKNRKSITTDDVMRIHGDIHSPNALYEMIKNLKNNEIKSIENNVSTLHTKRDVLLTIGGSILLLLLGIVGNYFVNIHNYESIQKQTQIEANINSLSEKNNDQKNSINALRTELEELRTKVNSSSSK